MFGAISNFFKLTASSITEGIYEVNPPFIEQVFVDSSRIVVDMLTRSQSQDKQLQFVYIMPDWVDSGGYQLLIKSGFLIDEIILKDKCHFYHQSSKNRLIIANFDTHVIIVGTKKSHSLWNNETKSQFTDNFTHY
jgi:hypothetical protein